MRLPKLSINSAILPIIIALFYTVVLNLTLANKLFEIFRNSESFSPFLIASVPLFFIAIFTLLFTLFTIKYVTKAFFTFLIMTSAMVNFGAYKFGVIFNADMMTNIFETTPAEAGSYSNPTLCIWLFLSGVLPCIILLCTKINYRPFWREMMAKAIVIIICLSVIGGIGALFYKDYASISRNNPKMAKDIIPTYYIGSTAKYIKARFFTTPLPYVEIGIDAMRTPEKEKYLTIFLVGETARAQNYQSNGYNRPTNAHTKDIPNLFSLQDVESCGTATAVSLPCMFSFMDRDNYSREKFDAQDNVVDVLKRSGIKATWIDNNTGCKGVCDAIEHFGSDEVLSIDCDNESCTDEVFIDMIDNQIASLKGQDGVIFMHLIGSHGPTYYKRYPRDHAYFLPDCQTSDLQQCTDEEILNSYDNTILYTDYVMAELIKKLKTYANTYHTSLIYVSDHGESLGENGIYLHGMPYSIAPLEQRRVPFMIWLSDKMIDHKKIDTTCLTKTTKADGFSHANIAPTLLNLMDIDTDAYAAEKDVLNPCEKE